MKKEKIFVYDKNTSILTISTTVLFFAASLALILCGMLDIGFLFAGVVFLLFFLVEAITLVFIRFYVIMGLNEIKVTTIFGKTVAVKQVAKLREIQIRHLKGREAGRYFIFKFSDENCTSKIVRNLMQEENFVLMAYSEKNLESVKRFYGDIAAINDSGLQ